MIDIEETLKAWGKSLCMKVELAAFLARNPVAHKWKATYRSLVLRETVSWRFHDLLLQSYKLHQNGSALGARILLRSALETLFTLVYVNQIQEAVVGGSESFHKFDLITARLLLGSRDKSTETEAINILTVLKKCQAAYPAFERMYASLSESAHPNFEGLCFGYSRVDHQDHVTTFSNNIAAMFNGQYIPAIELCIAIFQSEYNDVWPKTMTRLESWIAENDVELEASRPPH